MRQNPKEMLNLPRIDNLQGIYYLLLAKLKLLLFLKSMKRSIQVSFHYWYWWVAGWLPGWVGGWVKEFVWQETLSQTLFGLKLKFTIKYSFSSCLVGWLGGRVGDWICLKIKLTSALVLVEVELRLELGNVIFVKLIMVD